MVSDDQGGALGLYAELAHTCWERVDLTDVDMSVRNGVNHVWKHCCCYPLSVTDFMLKTENPSLDERLASQTLRENGHLMMCLLKLVSTRTVS